MVEEKREPVPEDEKKAIDDDANAEENTNSGLLPGELAQGWTLD